MTKLRWWISGIVAVALVAVTMLLLSSDDAPSVTDSPSVVSDLRTSPSSVADSQWARDAAATDAAGPSNLSDNPGAGSEAPDSNSDAPEAAVAGPDSDIEVSSSGDSGAGAAANTGTATTAGPVSSSGAANGLRLRIPSLNVDVLVVELGYNSEGQLDVPSDAYSVGWYSISARPGTAGNALLGGHLNWGGLRGVFDRLDELNDGDLIYLVEDGQEMVFQVSRLRSVTADAPLQDVLSAPAGGSTLTLFTCGGTFDRSAGEYDHRLVVNAVRVANGAG